MTPELAIAASLTIAFAVLGAWLAAKDRREQQSARKGAVERLLALATIGATAIFALLTR